MSRHSTADPDLMATVREVITRTTGLRVQSLDARAVSGGDMHASLCVTAAHNTSFFVKHNHRSCSDMFEAEAAGLGLLRSCGALSVPESIGTGSTSRSAFLVLQWIEPGPWP